MGYKCVNYILSEIDNDFLKLNWESTCVEKQNALRWGKAAVLLNSSLWNPTAMLLCYVPNPSVKNFNSENDRYLWPIVGIWRIMNYCLSAFPPQARRTSIPLSRESTKRRKQCVSHGQYKSTRLMTPHSDECEETDNCVNCDAQRSTNNKHNHQTENQSDGNMAFPALSVMGGGGQVVRSRSKVNINDPEDEQRSPYRHSIHIKNKETIILNVGGQIFETYKNTLTRLKSCKLARESELRRYYRESKGDYFFDRDPQLFSVVLNYLRTNELHLPTYLCGPAVQREFDYWGIDEEDIERCCWQPYNTWKTQNKSLEKLEYDRKRSMTQQHLEKDRRSPRLWIRCKAIVWNFLQNPNTSLGAKVRVATSLLGYFISQTYVIRNVWYVT